MRALRELAGQPLNWLPVGRAGPAYEWDLRLGGGPARAGWLRWDGGGAEAASAQGTYRIRRRGPWDYRVEVLGPHDPRTRRDSDAPSAGAAEPAAAVFRFERRVDWLTAWLLRTGAGWLEVPSRSAPIWWVQLDEPALAQRAHWAWAPRYGHPAVHVVHRRQLLRNRRVADPREVAELAGRVEFADGALELPELDVLVLLGWFLRLTAARDFGDF